MKNIAKKFVLITVCITNVVICSDIGEGFSDIWGGIKKIGRGTLDVITSPFGGIQREDKKDDKKSETDTKTVQQHDSKDQ